MEPIKFSIIVPAHNEEKEISKCLESIKAAAAPYGEQAEIIVVLNRCTDRTEEIALAYGCTTIKNDDRNLAKIRNAGARAARGEILVTIDADTVMSSFMLAAAEKLLATGLFIGGGVTGKFDRMSIGITASVAALSVPIMLKYGLISIGIFWCRKADFDAIGGFNEGMLLAEDCDFARRLALYGLRNQKLFGTIPFAMTTSSRKFDQYGDWLLIKRPEIIAAFLKENDQKLADQLYYDFEN